MSSTYPHSLSHLFWKMFCNFSVYSVPNHFFFTFFSLYFSALLNEFFISVFQFTDCLFNCVYSLWFSPQNMFISNTIFSQPRFLCGYLSSLPAFIFNNIIQINVLTISNSFPYYSITFYFGSMKYSMFCLLCRIAMDFFVCFILL